jgi:hypothetical protein
LILTALVLFCCNTISADPPRTPETPTAIEVKSSAPAEPTKEADNAKPDAPTPKAGVSSKAVGEYETGAEGGSVAGEPISLAPVKPPSTESYETSRQRKIWYELLVASHAAAAFDAWTTRQAVSGGYGVESDPFQRPFAHSGAIYASTQVSPLVMDYLGHRMMRSGHEWMRRAWWVPQAAGASVSLGSGIHNYRVVN